MWIKKFSKIYPGIQQHDLWQAWADANNWPKWDNELEYCEMQGEFIQGNKFILKPKGGSKVKIILSEVIENEKFTDYCKFLGATMYDAHELRQEPGGLRITNTISVIGPLSFIWANLVAKKVAAAVSIQTDNLVAYVRSRNA